MHCGARETADLTEAAEDLCDLEAADLTGRVGDPVAGRGDCDFFLSTISHFRAVELNVVIIESLGLA